MHTINTFLDKTTMYRVVHYALSGMAIYALVAGFAHFLPFSGLALLGSLITLIAVSVGVNALVARIVHAPTNIESSFITAFILFFIITPPTDTVSYGVVALTAAVAMVSKYLLAWHKKHLVNPAAAALVIVALCGFPLSAWWWVGTPVMLPVVLIASLLVVKKIRRFPLFFTYIIVSTATMLIASHATMSAMGDLLTTHFMSWATIFFAGIMLTEPLTIPGTKRLQIAYGAGIAVLATIPFHVGSVYSSPELALMIGNLLVYPWSLKRRIVLTLIDRTTIARDTYEMRFKPDAPVSFTPGQYLEWLLPHEDADLRGVRRYFTIASSPTEDTINLGIKCTPPNISTYKQHLFDMQPGDVLYAGQRAGDFVLPHDPHQKLVFIAGGIGITPFRSMLKYLIDRGERRDIVLFYCNKTGEDIAYQEILDEAERVVGLKVVHILGSGTPTPVTRAHEHGLITDVVLTKYVPDWNERKYYLSGPDAMVEAYSEFLHHTGVPRTHLTRDYFSGYA